MNQKALDHCICNKISVLQELKLNFSKNTMKREIVEDFIEFLTNLHYEIGRIQILCAKCSAYIPAEDNPEWHDNDKKVVKTI